MTVGCGDGGVAMVVLMTQVCSRRFGDGRVCDTGGVAMAVGC